MPANAASTTTMTASVRGIRQACRIRTSGASAKLKSSASAIGTRTSRPKYSAETIATVNSMVVCAEAGSSDLIGRHVLAGASSGI